MSSRAVLVVGETPSLGRAIADLLFTASIPCVVVPDLTAREVASWGPGPAPVLVVACNEAYCRTARRWVRGEFPGTGLVVVGGRDPELKGVVGARIVSLPLQGDSLLAQVRELRSKDRPDVA